jgi:type VI secretion system protein ImpA
MMIDVDNLLSPILVEPPCGPDLTYDQDFLALENAARGKSEQQFGDTVIPAEPPDWRDVERRAVALLARTKDVRVLVSLCRAWVNVRGLLGLSSGLEMLQSSLERYWEEIHPLPEDGDHFMRMNAVSSLNEVPGFLRDLRQADFLRSSAGVVGVREAEALVRGSPVEGGSKMSLDQLKIAVQDAVQAQNPLMDAVSKSADALGRINDWCIARLPGAQRPETDNLRSLLGVLKELIPANLSIGISVQMEAAADGTAATVINAVSEAQPGQLRNREDAIAQLLAVAAFVEANEPTNPAPMLIRRAARLMRMGFVDILRELSPDSLAHVENIIRGPHEP